MIHDASGRSARDLALADAHGTQPPPAAEGSPGGGGEGGSSSGSPQGSQGAGAQTQIAGTPGGSTAPATTATRETYFELDGKKYKAEIDENGKIISKDLQPILDNPRKHYEAHSTSVREKQLVQERKRIRDEELSGLHNEIRSLKEALGQIRPNGQPSESASATAKSEDGAVDWTQVDVNDPKQFIAALNKDAELRAEKKNKTFLDQVQARDRFQANKSLMEAYSSWKDYDEQLFNRILQDEGVAFTKDGPDYSKLPPHEVESIARESLKTLADLKGLDTRVDGAIGRAIGLMPAEFDEDMMAQVEMGFRSEMIRGRPTTKQEDCDLIAYEVAQRVFEKDAQRIVDRAAKYRAAFEKNKGGTEKVKTDVEIPPEKPGELKDLTQEERHERIRKAARSA